MEKNKKYNMTQEEQEYAYYLSNKEKELKAQISSADQYITSKKVKKAFCILGAILLPAAVIAIVASAFFVPPLGSVMLAILAVPEAAVPLVIYGLAGLASPFVLGSKVKDCNSDIESKKHEKEKYQKELTEIKNKQKEQNNKYKSQTHDEETKDMNNCDLDHQSSKIDHYKNLRSII